MKYAAVACKTKSIGSGNISNWNRRMIVMNSSPYMFTKEAIKKANKNCNLRDLHITIVIVVVHFLFCHVGKDVNIFCFDLLPFRVNGSNKKNVCNYVF